VRRQTCVQARCGGSGQPTDELAAARSVGVDIFWQLRVSGYEDEIDGGFLDGRSGRRW